MKFLLKHIIFTLIVLNWFSSLAMVVHAQCKKTRVSENRQYRLDLAGGCYDCYGGEWTYKFYESPSTLLWEKNLIWGGFPIISNLGETAIPQENMLITFYDSTGGKIGEFSAKQSGLTFFRDDMFGCLGVVHAYSSGGLQYYLALQNISDNSTVVLGLDHLGQKIWTRNLEEEHKTCGISVFPTSILLDDFCGAFSDYTNRAYLIERVSGRILKHYPTDISRPIFYRILPQEDQTFLLLENEKITQYHTVTGEKMGEIQTDDILSLLFTENPRNIHFVLNALLLHELEQGHVLAYLPENVINRIKDLNAQYPHTVDDILRILHIENLYYRDAHPYTGTVTEYYDNGNIRSEIQYKDGKKHGVETMWNENGGKREEIHYKQGIRDGTLTWWYPSGKVRLIYNYREGKKHGQHLEWYENGEKSLEETFENGLREGKKLMWCSNGNPYQVEEFKHDQKEGVWTYWNCGTGLKTYQRSYKNGKPDGVWIQWDAHRGIKMTETIYKDGIVVESANENRKIQLKKDE